MKWKGDELAVIVIAKLQLSIIGDYYQPLVPTYILHDVVNELIVKSQLNCNKEEFLSNHLTDGDQ